MDEKALIEASPSDFVRPPQVSLVVTEKEADTILESIGLGKIPASDRGGMSLSDMMKLGVFVEGSGVVKLDHGCILISRTVLMRQLIRLDDKAQTVANVEEMRDMSAAMASLGSAVAKLSAIGIKARSQVEAAKEMKPKQTSWMPGAMVGVAPGSTVLVAGPRES